ncbi:MAG TPA: TIGR02444 family protein [Synechococcales cyanobacterium M55_K2018_004]|nr:TIGR02444 family protein [Synechococcales cyanobacterium M55_K2018_004]
MSQPPPLENPFWQFSLRVYTLPGVAECCLCLQDQFGLSVNLLLFAAWMAKLGQSLSVPEVAQALQAIAPLETLATQPLRTLRRTMLKRLDLPTSWQQEWKQKLLAAELYAEQMQQAMLYQWAQTQVWGQTPLKERGAAMSAIASVDRTTLLHTTLHSYIQLVAAPPTPDLQATLQVFKDLLSQEFHSHDWNEIA